MTTAQQELLKKAWLCFSLAFLLFYSRLRSFTDIGNRMEIAWTPLDTVLIYAAAILCALILFSIWWVSKQLKLKAAITDRVFIIVVVLIAGWAVSAFLVDELVTRWVGPLRSPFDFLQFGRINYYGAFFPGLFRYIFLLFLVLGLTIATKLAKKILTLFLLIVSPISLVYPLGMLNFPSYSTIHGQLPAPSLNQSKGKRIFFFLYDEWDYQNTFHNTLGPLKLPGVDRLVKSSTMYHDAITTSALTSKSIPQILGAGGDANNLFHQAKNAGWKSYVVAGFLPYQTLYGSDLDYCYRLVWQKCESIPFRVRYEVQEGVLNAYAFWCPASAEIEFLKRSARDQINQTEKLQLAAVNLIERAAPNGFYYFHFTVPHWPFINEPEFAEQGLQKKPRMVHGYRHNLEVMDESINGVISTLERTKQWDESMIIFTGDHGWREDPIKPRPLMENRHPPLFIKFPGQKSARAVRERFDIRDLKRLIEKEMKS